MNRLNRFCGILCFAVLTASCGCQTPRPHVTTTGNATSSPADESVGQETSTVMLTSFQPDPVIAEDAGTEPFDAPTDAVWLPTAIDPVSPADAADPDDRVERLSLQDVIQLAAEANPDINAAIERTWIADATLNRARAEFYPTLSVSESYGVSNNPVNVFGFQLNQARLTFNQDFNNPATTDNFDTRLRFQHGLYTGGRRTAEQNAAEWQLQASHAGMASVRNGLVFRVAEAYFRLLQAHELIGVREETVEQVQRHLEIVKSRFRAETAVQSDVLSVEVRLAESQEMLIAARHQVELAWAVLDNVVGRPVPRRTLPDVVPSAPWDAHLADVESAVSTALAIRPELQQAGSNYQSALYGIQAAESGKKASVNLVGDYDVFTGDFRSGNDSFFVGLVVQLNLLDFGRTSAERDRASAQARVIAAGQRKAVSDIELDVRQAWLQLSDARERLAVTEKAIEQARESLREVEVRYRGQTETITRLIDAQVSLSNTRVRRANSQADIEIARASLERATGRLTSFLTDSGI